MNVTKDQITKIASAVGLDYARLMAFITVESGGIGFSTETGKIIIQFEPTWFHKYLIQFKVAHEYTASIGANGKKSYKIIVGDKTLINGVEGQHAEWEAFNTAFAIHPKAAMLSTSIGLMQVMGFNYKASGYNSVDEMWDDFKKGEVQQIQGAANFIKSVPALLKALQLKDWPHAAYYYNGEGYAINHYDTKLSNAYIKYSQ